MKSKRRWTKLSHEALLDRRICDLALTLKKTPLRRRVHRLYHELEAKGIRFRPHCWLSLEWFSPYGEPGVAIPFYLAHPRLKKLEERMMLELEGGTTEWFMRLLRHEAGHAIETAYRLGDRRAFQKVFGNPKKPYPESYKPNPASLRFVRHLGYWYAQAHAHEDFAETFAVWLRPGSRWRRDYRGWPALKKLLYVDRLMKEIARKPPLVRSRRHEEPISVVKDTLDEYYRKKRHHYRVGQKDTMDRDLLHLFPRDSNRKKTMALWLYIRRNRRELAAAIGDATRTEPYLAEQVLHEMMLRARFLDLSVKHGQSGVKLRIAALVTTQVREIVEKGYPRIIV